MDWRQTIRSEQPADTSRVEALLEAAFETPAEAALVEVLRRTTSPLVSLVAENRDGLVVGHILFSPVEIEGRPGLAMGLAPLAVQPGLQGRGVGSALVKAGLERCRALGVVAVVVLGHPVYYPRFGFTAASKWGLRSEYDVPDEVFMAIELVPGALAGEVPAKVRYAPPFSEV